MRAIASFTVLVSTAWLVAMPVVVLAADPDGGHGGGGTLPQFDISTFPSQIFWLLVVFAVTYRLLSRKYLPRMAEILEHRAEKIDGDLAQAETMRAEAEAAKTGYETGLKDAREAAQTALDRAEAEAKAEAAKKIAASERSIKGRITKTENRLEEQRAAALKDLPDIVGSAVSASVEKIVGAPAADADVKRAVTTALKEGGQGV